MYEKMTRYLARKHGLANDLDCMQEIRICLWYQLPKFNPTLGMKESSYAWQQIQYAIKTYLAKKKPEMPSLDTPLGDGTPWIDTIASEPEKMYPDLYKALRNLNLNERELIELYFFKGLTLSEIGASYQKTRQCIDLHLIKILKKLRRYL